jgi:sarcosine oxidase, subunit alpha
VVAFQTTFIRVHPNSRARLKHSSDDLRPCVYGDASVVNSAGQAYLPLTSLWNGKRIRARPGDTIAAALWRQGVLILGASRKRHRPLGLSGAYLQGELVQVSGVPHVRASTCQVSEGLNVRSQNVWPHYRFNLLLLLGLVPDWAVRGGFERSMLFPSGTRRFQWWERLLMLLAGEVSVSPEKHAQPALMGNAISVDVAVVGGGRFGREAANAAVRRGQAVLLATPSPTPGERSAALGGDLPPLESTVQILAGHTVVGLYREGRLVVAAPHDASRAATVISAGEVILATGRRSCPPLLPGHDLPGVLDVHTAMKLARMIGPALGPCVVVGTGAETLAASALRSLGVQVVASASITALEAIQGKRRISAVKLDAKIIDCETLIHAGPWMSDPSLKFQASATGSLRLLAGELPASVVVVGAAASADESVHCGNAEPKAHTTVCPCMDVTVGEILGLALAGERHIEVLKRATGCGMGPCQGFPCWALSRAVLHDNCPGIDLSDRPSHRPPRAGLTVRQAAGLDGLVSLD